MSLTARHFVRWMHSEIQPIVTPTTEELKVMRNLGLKGRRNYEASQRNIEFKTRNGTGVNWKDWKEKVKGVTILLISIISEMSALWECTADWRVGKIATNAKGLCCEFSTSSGCLALWSPNSAYREFKAWNFTNTIFSRAVFLHHIAQKRAITDNVSHWILSARVLILH